MQYYQLEAGDTGRPRLDQIAPSGSKVESSLWFSYRYDAPLPGLVPDFFAGVMDFWIKIESAGPKQFWLRGDDRVWLWLDGWTRDAPGADGKRKPSGAHGQRCDVNAASEYETGTPALARGGNIAKL